MSSDLPERPDPEIEEPERAPGGPDADVNESDVGAASKGDGTVTPDVPLSAQHEQENVPDEVQSPEETEKHEETEGDNSAEPSA